MTDVFNEEMVNIDELDLDYWKNMDEKAITAEINGLVSRIDKVSNELYLVVDDNNYEQIKELIAALMTKDLGAGGWIHSYLARNRDNFPNNGNTKPEWYSKLNDKERYYYDINCRNFEYLVKLEDTCQKLFDMLMKFNFYDTFRIQRIKENLLENYFSEKDYENFVQDAYDVEAMINTPWETLDGLSPWSDDYYVRNKNKSDIEKGYRQARIKDYQEWFNRRGVKERMDMRSDGTFTVNAAAWADAGVIDKYTREISKMKKLQDDIDKTLEDSVNILVSVIPPLEKEINGICYGIVSALKGLADAVKNFVTSANNVYDGFKKGADAAPYCFMKKPSALASPKKKYSYQPKQWNPIEEGTGFQSLYKMEAEALTEHCRAFVYDQGII